MSTETVLSDRRLIVD